jgi:probable HAF family extracellular repeat protein
LQDDGLLARQLLSDQIVAVCSAGPCVYANGSAVNIGSFGGGQTQAEAINASGAVVGYSYFPNGNFHGFLWAGGKMTDLGTLGGDWSQAYAINNAGQITGTGYTPQNLGAHAFLYANGSMKDLGALPGGTYSTGAGINSSGLVVGYAQIPNAEATVYHAFVYTASKMQDLNDLISANSGWVLSEATAVNDSGQIVGYGTIAGNEHAFLLTPVN